MGQSGALEREDAMSDETATAEDMEQAMLDLLEGGPAENLVEAMERCSTFESALLLTTDHEPAIRMANGAEFQITIVRSKAPVKVAVGE
jgi:hypothetical protein